MTLYNIQGEYLRLYDLMTSEDEVDGEAVANALEELDMDLAEKSAGYVHVIRQLEMEADECDKVIEAFQRKKQVRENNVKRMKEAIMHAMDIANLSEVPAGDYKIKVVNNGGKAPLVIPDESLVPDRYMKIKYEPDKELIRKTIEDGTDLPFAEIKDRGRHLNIK